ncbi:MAG: aldehyde dehydrogenase family protein [Actinomycetota bacterium]|nr:aldehyde dehydrogenase family protein [Actinomycetota bacterium]
MDTNTIDIAIASLNANKTRWARLPIATKIYLLDDMRRRVGTVAHEWVEAAAVAKQIPTGSQLVGEEWTSGPYALAAGAAAIADTLRRIEDGTPILEGFSSKKMADGQLAVQVFPANFEDRLFLSGHTAEVWMRPGVEEEDLERGAASFYRTHDPEGSVTLVLGAGNIASIAPLDVLTELFNYGSVTAVKLNPVNAYLGPFLEEIFGSFVDGGFVRFVHGGTEEGVYLTRHDLIEHIHVTGAATTHDAIVYGVGEEGARRKIADEPVNSTPVTSELGGVGPTIVAGGEWSDADLRYQAAHIMSQKLHNHGFNCIACQVLVLPEEWDQADALLDAMRAVVVDLGQRGAYYPGARERHSAAVAAHEDAEILTDGEGPVTFITDLDPAASDDICFTTEFFGAVLGVVRLPGSTTEEFLENAVKFANETLDGNLGANLIIHPATAKRDPEALEAAIHDLRYGTIAVNSWVGIAFAMNRATWGAFPGNPRNDIASGTGVVHNSLMLEDTERTVVRGAFAPFPRTLRQGVVHTEPTPPFFVTNRRAAHLGELLTEAVVSGSRKNLPAIVATAMRG